MTKILLVEDDKNLREIYGTRLYAEGYDIVSAGDGEEALAMAIRESPDLIISDVMMPKISGFDMLDILRTSPDTKDIPVIMMTALSSEDQRARGESLGATRYLVKSQVGIEDVVRTVHDVLGDAPGAVQPQAAATQVNTAPSPDTGISVPQRQQPSMPQPVAPQPDYSQPTVASQSQSQPEFQQAPQTQPQATPFQQPAAPQPQVVPQQPSAPQQPPQPQAAPPQPQQPPTTPVAPPVDQQPTNDGALPRPIAPFSTKRPAGLGDRVIHPLEQPAGNLSDDLASKMAAALSDESNQIPPMPVQPEQPAQMQQPSQPEHPSQQSQPIAPPQHMTQQQPAVAPPTHEPIPEPAPNDSSQPTTTTQLPEDLDLPSVEQYTQQQQPQAPQQPPQLPTA